jgi:S-DNA-T family DNA segregation ATPase FtsK/SpoIIIE
LLFLFSAISLTLSLVSYRSSDPSWNTAAGPVQARNLIGSAGSHTADLCLQVFGLASFALPVFLVLLAWKWIRSKRIDGQAARTLGFTLFVLSACTAFTLVPGWRVFDGVIAAGGLAGMFMAGYLTSVLNVTGAALLTGTCWIVSVYLVSSFSMFELPGRLGGLPRAREAAGAWWRSWRAGRRRRPKDEQASVTDRARERAQRMAQHLGQTPAEAPWAEDAPAGETEIPIRMLEDAPLPPAPDPETVGAAGTPEDGLSQHLAAPLSPPAAYRQVEFRLPSTELLNEPAARNSYDRDELKEIAAVIKSKLEEFSVFGSVVQINPGPVVTTFEFKPEPGIKYSRITTLSEDLCLGLQAESILIERIPGKPTVGIEVPNNRRELISLRQVLESGEFRNAKARLPLILGKDINGRIKATALENMPHLLIAGSTGSGKSVMLNSMIMSTLFKATPDEVRMIVVDPKRVELGVYDGIPHLLTPVITDPREATNALRNAVLEMERRLKLLASHGVRNIEQFNRKMRTLLEQPRKLFPEQGEEFPAEEPRPLPYILIVIDELADLMMVERANVEAAVTRLAQMARAVGVHLVLATQRPSVDIITGLIKANFPARVSFRVATRVDSRTVLDVMGAEHLLGRGDMLFLPPGSSRLIRVHGALVTENEINRVVEFWKEQAIPNYDESFLAPPPSDDAAEAGGVEQADDPAYEDAVRVVLEMGKASTSTLQRRLRLGYGRAARLLDMMQQEGIVSAPDGSRPREVLKAPDWLREVEEQLR